VTVKDIREGSPDEYWQRLRAMMGPSGLMSYWYLGRAFNQHQDPDTMKLRSDMRNPHGGILAAPLALAAPETGGWRDREVIPAPVAYGLHILDDAVGVSEIRITRSTVRKGRRMGFSRSEVVDAHDPNRVIAITTGIGITLGDAPPGFEPIELPPDVPDTEDLPPLHVVFGVARDPDGWRLPELSARHASTSASLHIGPIHVAFEAAAVEAAATHVDTDRLQVEHWDTHFISPGSVGPFLVEVDSVAGHTDRVAARMTLLDEGRDNAIVAAGAATFRRVGQIAADQE
jgi:hypothetical protein